MASLPYRPTDHGILPSSTLPKSPATPNVYDMGPIDLANHFIKTICKRRADTLIKQNLKHVPLEISLLSNLNELVVYNPQEDSLYRYRVDDAPKKVVQKLEGLAHAQDFGVRCFNQLYEALKKAIRAKSISETPEEDFGKGVEGIVAMLGELSLQIRPRVQSDYTVLEDTDNIKVHVVLVDGHGDAHRYSHFLHPNVNFQSFLDEMDQKFSKYCNPYDQWAYKNWDVRVQDLKKTGFVGDPALDRIEELIAAHKTTEFQVLPQWMYYTVLEGGARGPDGEALDVEDDESFRTVLERAAKKEHPACLMRITEARFQNIFFEIRFLEEKQLDPAPVQERARIEDQDQDQQPGYPGNGTSQNANAGSDDPFFDPEPLGTYHSLTYFYNLDHNNLKYLEGGRMTNSSTASALYTF